MASSDRGDQSNVDPACQLVVACMFDVLTPDMFARILKLLSDSPEDIVAFSLTCSQAHQLCSDETIWRSLCSELTASLPQQYRNVNWEPAAWHTESYQELYMCLLHPYRPLLQQRVWWTTKMAAGQLLVVDAQPPLLVGRSVSYNSLRAGPVSHAVFVVRMPRTPPHAAEQPHSKGKAEVLCCCCQPTRVLAESQHELIYGVRSGEQDSLCRATYMAAADLTFTTGQHRNAPAATAAAAGAAGEPADVTVNASQSAPAQQAVQAAGAGGAAVQAAGAAGGQSSRGSVPPGSNLGRVHQHTRAGSPAAAAAAAAPVLSLRCRGWCGNLYGENLSRKRYANDANFTPQGTTEPAAQPAAAADTASGLVAAAAAAPAGAAAAGPMDGDDIASNQDGSSSSSSSSLPLPDMIERESFPVWDLRYYALEADIPAEWRSSAEYRPFHLPTWLQPSGHAAASTVPVAGPGVGGASSTSRTAEASSSSSRGSSGGSRALPVATAGNAAAAAAAAAAEGLTGLWRGSYGTHGVELVALQLLQASPGFQLQQQYGPVDGTPHVFETLPRNVLLQPVLRLPPHFVHLALREALCLPHDQAEHLPNDGAIDGAYQAVMAAQQAEILAGVNAVSLGPSVVGNGGRNPLQQQQQQGGEVSALHPPQQLLLVATKVTGDRNVPAGQVTFAVDLGSRSSAGAGQLLQLPPGTTSDVKVNERGAQPLVIKERYSGLAQIAENYFQGPRMLPVELLVFEAPDCLGLLWKPPMDSFSLLSRVSGLL